MGKTERELLVAWCDRRVVDLRKAMLYFSEEEERYGLRGEQIEYLSRIAELLTSEAIKEAADESEQRGMKPDADGNYVFHNYRELVCCLRESANWLRNAGNLLPCRDKERRCWQAMYAAADAIEALLSGAVVPGKWHYCMKGKIKRYSIFDCDDCSYHDPGVNFDPVKKLESLFEENLVLEKRIHELEAENRKLRCALTGYSEENAGIRRFLDELISDVCNDRKIDKRELRLRQADLLGRLMPPYNLAAERLRGSQPLKVAVGRSNKELGDELSRWLMNNKNCTDSESYNLIYDAAERLRGEKHD